MLTRWGETLDKQQVLQEYPRPQLVRERHAEKARCSMHDNASLTQRNAMKKSRTGKGTPLCRTACSTAAMTSTATK